MQQVTNEWIREGERRGERRGKQRGRQEERRQIVLKMHQQGFPPDVIASITELKVSQIAGIIQSGSK